MSNTRTLTPEQFSEALPRTLIVTPPLTDAEFESLCLDNDLVQFERKNDGLIHMHSPTGRFTASEQTIYTYDSTPIRFCRFTGRTLTGTGPVEGFNLES